ncbi:MAG TPA: hypothetical protein VFA55_01250 [Candidatus Kapabacteria bacterium]|nr:hypothetical protein [Candidatus Kapabacteria bacterium]
MRNVTLFFLALCTVLFLATDSFAGGPWVGAPGSGSIIFGYSRKTALSSWDDQGNFSTANEGGLLRHDFRYAYLNPSWVLFPHLEFDANFNYLWGYEATSSDVVTGAKLATPYYHYNAGPTDFWADLKYQFMEGDYPMAIMVQSRFPDLYSSPGDYTGTEIPITKAPGTDVEGPEWRGLMKRDLGFYVLAGHSFGAQAYAQSQLGYNLRQGAFADQWYFEIDGGYNFYNLLGTNKLTVKAFFDYTGGVGNGAQPNLTDRFDSPTTNNNFNNSKAGRLYGGLIYAPSPDSRWALEGGVGQWLFGRGSVDYTETYGQIDWYF